MEDLLSVADLDPDALRRLLDLADELRSDRRQRHELTGRTVALIFEKPSTRTRVSFQVAVAELGGHPLPLSAQELQLGRGETLADTGVVLSRYVHAIVLRTFGQDRLEQLAAAAAVPVVNALSDSEHPCQALADLQTVRTECGTLEGVTLAYVGDGNNVAHSLLLAGGLARMQVRIGHPSGYAPDTHVVEQARALGATVVVTEDARAAVQGADAVYTDVWASMGQEAEAEQRRRTFAPYRVDATLMRAAAPGAIFLHCLPAHRGEEVTDEVLDGPASRVLDQAENRLHVQKALLLTLLGGA
ncbi:MAG TPA: ornithine carbamoyltransferase [Nitriliruptorales bacterium]|nr:ornithine carbamoyltransferase [Nitriliruptorales bacterium]